MKRFLMLILLTTFILSCADKKEPQEKSNETIDIPAGAEQVVYTDTPELIQVIVRDNDGKMTSSGLLRNNQKDGVWVEYQQRGMAKSMIAYYNGKKEGAAIEITENGQVAKQYNHHIDVLDGEYKEFNYSTL